MCALREDMQVEMSKYGYHVGFIGLVDDGMVMVLWVNPEEGSFMVHRLDMDTDVECHILNGVDYASDYIGKGEAL